MIIKCSSWSFNYSSSFRFANFVRFFSSCFSSYFSIISIDASMQCIISIAWAKLLWNMFLDGNLERYFCVLFLVSLCNVSRLRFNLESAPTTYGLPLNLNPGACEYGITFFSKWLVNWFLECRYHRYYIIRLRDN